MATVVLTQVNRRSDRKDRESDRKDREEELRQKADAEYVAKLERRVDRAERGLEECLEDRDALRRRIEALERKV